MTMTVKGFLRIFNGLDFEITTAPSDPQKGDMYFDGSNFYICKDGVTFTNIDV